MSGLNMPEWPGSIGVLMVTGLLAVARWYRIPIEVIDAARSESGLPVHAVYGAGARLPGGPGDRQRNATVVGVNKFTAAGDEPYEPLGVDPQIEADQCERLAVLGARRDNQAVTGALSDLRRAAAGTGCVLPPTHHALALRATGGEIAHALRDVWGVYQPQETL
jgi:methylmalonyl-CoA mutase N-terminal domain/subunit